jgi:hypothetical protein
VLNPRLLPDVIDRELDVVCEPVRLDDGPAAGVLSVALIVRKPLANGFNALPAALVGDT